MRLKGFLTFSNITAIDDRRTVEIRDEDGGKLPTRVTLLQCHHHQHVHHLLLDILNVTLCQRCLYIMYIQYNGDSKHQQFGDCSGGGLALL